MIANNGRMIGKLLRKIEVTAKQLRYDGVLSRQGCDDMEDALVGIVTDINRINALLDESRKTAIS